MADSETKPQPDPRSGSVRVALGVWDETAIRILDALAATDLVWLSSIDGNAHVATIAGKPMAKIHRVLRGQPWLVRIHGFQFWVPPGRIIKHWHYTASLAVDNLREARKLIAEVIADRHKVDD